MKALRKYFLPLAFGLFATTCALPAAAQEWPVKRTAMEVRKVPDSVVNKMKREPDFQYANDSSYWEENETEPGAFARFINAISRSGFFKIILYIILAAGIIFAIYQVMVANNFFIVSGKRRKVVGREEGEDDISPENIDERILEETRNKNYRQAVRYMYLKTLKLLSESNFITLHAKSTNKDYIRQMNNHKNLAQFRQLTRVYEYVWYGEFDPNEAQFELIRTNFNQFSPRS